MPAEVFVFLVLLAHAYDEVFIFLLFLAHAHHRHGIYMMIDDIMTTKTCAHMNTLLTSSHRKQDIDRLCSYCRSYYAQAWRLFS